MTAIFLKKALITTLSISILIIPLYSQEDDPCIAAKLDAKQDIDTNLWLGAGFCGGFIGLGASYIIESTPSATRLVGKSPEYVAVYTDCYKAETKEIKTSKAKTGFLAYLGCCVLYFVAVVGASG